MRRDVRTVRTVTPPAPAPIPVPSRLAAAQLAAMDAEIRAFLQALTTVDLDLLRDSTVEHVEMDEATLDSVNAGDIVLALLRCEWSHGNAQVSICVTDAEGVEAMKAVHRPTGVHLTDDPDHRLPDLRELPALLPRVLADRLEAISHNHIPWIGWARTLCA